MTNKEKRDMSHRLKKCFGLWTGRFQTDPLGMSGEREDGEAHEEEGGAKQEQQIESPVASSNTVPGPKK